MSTLPITEPGAYADISQNDYHGIEICDAPSISSSGLKLITTKSPRHYWWQSPLNPARAARDDKPHFSIGLALHDVLLLDGKFGKGYHITPEGFDARQTIKWGDAVEALAYARRKGKVVLTHDQSKAVIAMAASINEDELARALITAGEPEMTLAAKDPETGVWLRARPDVLPTVMDIIPDIKTAADAALEPYERAVTRFGYFQSAAHYIDVIDLIYGQKKRRFVLITVEKTPPYCVVIDHLDDSDIDLARLKNRAAINKFADALKTGVWPAYTRPGEIRQLLMTNYERSMINEAVDRGELSYHA